MNRLRIPNIFLKIIFLGVFFFLDLAMSSSGGISTSMIILSDNVHSLSEKITNDLSDNDNFKNLDTGIQALLNKFEMKGASIAVAKDGRLIYAKGIGYADTETGELVEPGHMFRVASISKLITAIAIMKMRENGLLDLDDKVFGKSGILNDSIYTTYVDRRVENITVRHLLNHASGWSRRYGDHMFMPHIIAREMKAEYPVRTPDIIRFALKKRLHFNPGAGTSYSNLGYVILGEVIASVSGMSYENYVKQTILLPLGIKDMRLGKNLETGRFDNEVRYYEQSNAIKVNSIYNIEEMVPESYGGNDIENLGAAGGWIASPVELLRLVVSIDDQNGLPLILSKESIGLMNGSSIPGSRLIGWTGTDRKGNYWRTGTFAGTSALVMRQNNGLTWVALFNSSTFKGTTLASDVRRAVQPALNKVNEWPDHDLFHAAGSPPVFTLVPADTQ